MLQTTLPDRAVVRLSGDDVRGFLQGLVTSDVAGPLPVWAALLSAQGKCLFDFLLWEDGDDILIDCEAAAADDLIKRLAMYRLRRAITIARDDTLAVHWQVEAGQGVPDPRLAAMGFRWISFPRARRGQSGEAATALRASGPPLRGAIASTGCRSGCARGAASLATCYGWNAMPTN